MDEDKDNDDDHNDEDDDTKDVIQYTSPMIRFDKTHLGPAWSFSFTRESKGAIPVHHLLITFNIQQISVNMLNVLENPLLVLWSVKNSHLDSHFTVLVGQW